MARHRGKNQTLRPAGQIRRSQVVTTFGPGAMVDLIDHAVLVGGLDFWHYDSAASGVKVLHEPRLRDRIVQMGIQLSQERAFREPPAGDDHQPSWNVGIEVLEFPAWFVCQNPDCRALRHKRALEMKSGRYYHECPDGKRSECVPVRFVAACRKGHIEDFPWVSFVHDYGPSCSAPRLRLIEGATGDFSEVVVECTNCGKRRSLSAALAQNANPQCRGHRPWIGSEADEDCDERLRLLVRTASNSYFSQVVSALSIPEKGLELENAVRAVWDVLAAATKENLAAFRQIPKVSKALTGFGDDEVLAAVEALKKGETVERGPLRTSEYVQFVQQIPEEPGVLPPEDETFFARSYDPPGGLPEKLGKLVLTSKLREVRAQIGFTRLEPVSADLQGEFESGVELAALGLSTDWLPATEILGEGLFLALDEDAVAQWENRKAVRERGRELLDGYRKWAATVKAAPPFPGVRFYMLHSLSHLLISAISLECGYAASAIRERIYCSPHDSDTPMAAILLHTGSTGSEGTLGGLVEEGRRIGPHLEQAIRLGKLCSNDPVCAAHSPKTDPSGRYLEGAACHGCLFIAESSCERFNRYLDRALVVPTIGHPSELAFFEDPS